MASTSPVPPPPPPAPPAASDNRFLLLAGLGGVIVALLIVVIAMLVTRDSDSASSTSTALTGTQSTTSESTVPPTTTTLPPLFSLQPGQVLVSGAPGLSIFASSGRVGQVLATPTQMALAVDDGSIVYHAVDPAIYPNEWPSFGRAGSPTVHRILPDGSDTVIYQGGDLVTLFQVVEIPAVASGPSVVLLRSDLTDDLPFRSDSIVIAPLDGSAPHVISNVSGFESGTTGVAWMGDLFAVSFSGEGLSAFDTLDLDGNRVPWPANPEPADRPDFESYVSNLTRVGESTLIAYTRVTGNSFDAPVDLVVYDTALQTTVVDTPFLPAGFDPVGLHASEAWITASTLTESGGIWPWAQGTVFLYDLVLDSIEQVGEIGVSSAVG